MYLIILRLLTILALGTSAALADPTNIAINKATYGEFLLGEWSSQKPNLVVFKDPYCPYCIKHLRSIDRLENYNVFLFWAPILGERSITRVREILSCEDPVSEDIIMSVIEKKSPACQQSTMNLPLVNKNDAVVAAYDPKYVPQYWVAGKRVKVSELEIFDRDAEINNIQSLANVVLDWSRYTSNKVVDGDYN